MKLWDDSWRQKAETDFTDCFYRLCDCCNVKADIVVIASLMHEYNDHMSAEECFDRTLEWIGDWNGQYNLTDLTPNEYEAMLKKVK